jgi:hypothetical protein
MLRAGNYSSSFLKVAAFYPESGIPTLLAQFSSAIVARAGCGRTQGSLSCFQVINPIKIATCHLDRGRRKGRRGRVARHLVGILDSSCTARFFTNYWKLKAITD